MSGQNLWMALVKAGVVSGAAPQAGQLESPWYVKVLLALSGWVAAVCLLGFIGMGFWDIVEDETMSFIIGTMMICGAFVILRNAKHEFLEHLALAMSLAGQVLVVYSIFEYSDGIETGACLLVVLLQSVLAACMPNYVHRVFSAFIGAFAFSMALTSAGGLSFMVSGGIMFFAAWCWLNEFRYPRYMVTIQAVGYGLVLALLVLKSTELYGNGDLRWLIGHAHPEVWSKPWMDEVLTGGVTLYVVWKILQRYLQSLSERFAMMALLGTFIVCVLSVEVHGLTVAMVIMLLGFSGTNRVLLGLGIASLLTYISSYYYLLDTTLLVKSITLFVVGLALLIFRWLILQVVPVKKEEKHV